MWYIELRKSFSLYKKIILKSFFSTALVTTGICKGTKLYLMPYGMSTKEDWPGIKIEPQKAVCASNKVNLINLKSEWPEKIEAKDLHGIDYGK